MCLLQRGIKQTTKPAELSMPALSEVAADYDDASGAVQSFPVLSTETHGTHQLSAQALQAVAGG